MLDKTSGGPGQERLEFNGRQQYPEWLHVIAMAIDITTRPPTHGTRYVLHRDNTRSQYLGLPNRSPAHSRHAAPPRNYPELQIHTLQSQTIDRVREPGGTEPTQRPRLGRT